MGGRQAAGLPVIVTRDSHYVEPERPAAARGAQADGGLERGRRRRGLPRRRLPHDRRRRAARLLRAARCWPPGWRACAELAEAAYVRLPELETFTLKVPRRDGSAGPAGRARGDGLGPVPLPARWPPTWPDAAPGARPSWTVIKQGGMAPYLLLRQPGLRVHAGEGDRLPRPRLRGRLDGLLPAGDQPGGPVALRAALRPVPVPQPDEATGRGPGRGAPPPPRGAGFIEQRWAVRAVRLADEVHSLEEDERGRRRPRAACGSALLRLAAQARRRGRRQWRRHARARTGTSSTPCPT